MARNQKNLQIQIKTFTDRVLDVVSSIPRGSVLTYKQVALLAGSPRAYRVVGNIMKANRDEHVPCHRVIRSDGAVGDYNRGGSVAKKKKLLQEGYNQQL